MDLWVVVNVYFLFPHTLTIALCFNYFWKYTFPEKPIRENKMIVVKNMNLPWFDCRWATSQLCNHVQIITSFAFSVLICKVVIIKVCTL